MRTVLKTKSRREISMELFMGSVVLIAMGAATASGAAVARAPFKISRATTYFTAPVLPSGRINYVAVINAWAKRGVTKANNAGALVAKTLKIKGVGAGYQRRFYKGLGIRIPKPSQAYREWFDYAQRHFLPKGMKPYVGKAEFLFRKSGDATMHPWTTAQYPHVAAWLKVTRPALRLLMRASKMREFYLPMLTRHAHGHGRGIPIYILLPNLSTQRSEANALLRFAMHDIAEGHAGVAAKALLALCRLGALESRQPTMISNLVSYADSTVATRAVGFLLAHHDLPKPQEQLLLRGLQGQPPFASLIPAANLEGRCIMLGAIEQLASGHGRGFNRAMMAAGRFNGKPPLWPNGEMSQEKKFFALVRWNRVLKAVNHLSDQTVAALRQPGYLRKKLALQVLAARVKMDHVSLAQPPWTAAPLSPRADTQDILNFYVTSLYENPLKVLQYRDDAILQQRVVESTLALAIYHADHHAYPRTLAALAPKLLAHRVKDPFTDAEFVYQRRGAGYTLQARSPIHGRHRPKMSAGFAIVVRRGK